MASALVRELLDAGVHFGHHCSRWNPKMAPYLYGRRNRIHIIDIRETVRGLLRAQRFLGQLVAKGEDVLFVGTKRQARDAVQTHADRCGMPYVIERWLGGTLTNARTIRGRLQRLRELEELVASPKWEAGYSKKMKSMLLRELKKIQRNLSGVRNMSRLPGALIVVDVRKERNAVKEAQSLGIPTICLLDTDGDPDYASIPIPCNDDAMRAIDLLLGAMADAIEEGKKSRPEPAPETAGEGGPGPRRRGRYVPPPVGDKPAAVVAEPAPVSIEAPVPPPPADGAPAQA